MGHILVSKNEITNAILAADRAATIAASRSLCPDAAWLDGYRAALETVAVALGVYVKWPDEARAWSVADGEKDEPRPWRIVDERGPAERLVVIERGGK